VRARRVIGVCLVAAVAAAGCGGSSTKPTNATQRSNVTGLSTVETATTVLPQDIVADKAAAEAAALKLTDLPAGWTAQPHVDSPDVPSVDAEVAKCLGISVQELNSNGPADVNSPDFSDANNDAISNSLGYTASVATARHDFSEFANPNVPSCLSTGLTDYLRNQAAHPATPSATTPPGVTYGGAGVAPLYFPPIGDQSVAYRIEVPVTSSVATVTVFVDLVVAIKGRAGSEMDFTAIGTPFPMTEEQRYVSLVIGRLT
jgi:hypothetical protein